MTILEETAFLLAVSWWCAFARASEPELRMGARAALRDEDVFEAHADSDLVGLCDCDACYRHRVRCAQREDDAELTGSRAWRPIDDDLTDISF